jgi:dihydrofolate reductase
MAATNPAKITLHMVSSLDGFIARPDNSVAWMHTAPDAYPQGQAVSPEEIAAFLRTIDCYLMGSRTYEHALELGWPYGDTPVVVLTSRRLPAGRPTVEFYSGDLRQLVNERLAPRFRSIWLVGGALAAQRFLELGLVDDIKLTLAPVLLGGGLRMFGPLQEQHWQFCGTTAYRNGFVELTYSRITAR